jgi:hypothetical protein
MSSFSHSLRNRVALALVGIAGIQASCTSNGPSAGTGKDGGSSGATSTAGSTNESGAATAGATSNGGAGGGCLGKQCNPGGGTATGGDAVVGGEGGAPTAGTDAGGSNVGGSGGSSGGSAGSGGSGGGACISPAAFVDLSLLIEGPRSVEAEIAVLSGTAAIASNGTGFTGSGFVDLKGGEGDMIWEVSVPVEADYVLSWTSCAAEERPMTLDVNCAIDQAPVVFASTGAWESAWQTTTQRTAHLTKGLNRIRLRTNGSSAPNIDKMTISPPSCELKTDATVVCEAEEALQTGMAGVAMVGGGWTGSGFADMFGGEGGVAWFLDAPEAGKYSITFSYAQDDVRDMTVRLNGAILMQSLGFKNTHTWNTGWAADVTIEVDLVQGLNALRIATNGGSGPNFDNLSAKLLPDLGTGGAGGAGGAATVP